MYTDYFGLSQVPFKLTSDPRFFYANRNHQEAYVGLRYGIKLRQGVTVLTGEVGAGKTNLLKVLKERSESNIHIALIVAPPRDFPALLRLMMLGVGLAEPPPDPRQMR